MTWNRPFMDSDYDCPVSRKDHRNNPLKATMADICLIIVRDCGPRYRLQVLNNKLSLKTKGNAAQARLTSKYNIVQRPWDPTESRVRTVDIRQERVVALL
ncbi:hypothetical protein NHJ13734_009328 [Beauveria thailandica]